MVAPMMSPPGPMMGGGGMDPMAGAGGMGPMAPPAPPAPQTSSPQIDLALMRDLFDSVRPADPYGEHFKRPPRPDMKKMYDLGLKKFMDYDVWRAAVRHDLQLLRMDVHGIFPDDKPMLDAGILDDYESPALVSELNLAVSFLSGLNYRFLKHPCGNEAYAYDTRKVQLAAQWLYEMESRQHTNQPEMSTSILIPRILLPYGLIVKSRTINPMSEEWQSPFTTRYIDPAQIVFDPGPNSTIKRLWRIYNATAGDLMATYGEFGPEVSRALKEKFPDWDEDTELINVVEYWDPWWRFVSAGDGIVVLPVTEHKYGEVPFSFGFGPLGEPRATRLPEEWGSASMSRETFRDNIQHKSVGFIRFIKRSHLIRDAVMTRHLYGQKIALWPPIIRKQGMNANENPAPELEPYPNSTNYASDDESIEKYPFQPTPFDTAAIMNALDQDDTRSMAPASAYGAMNQSNISGTANKQALAAGRHLWQPWARTIDDFLGADLTQAMRLWHRLGNNVIYGRPGRTRQFTVPNPRPRKGESKSFDLAPEIIAKVGPHIYVKSDATDFSDTVRANTFKILNESGLPKPYLMEELYARDYGPELEEEWREEQVIAQMFQHPKFMETFGVPIWVASELEEHEGDEDYQKLLTACLQNWIKVVTEPAMMEVELNKQQLQTQLMQGQQQQMQQMMGGSSMNAPTNEQSYSEDQGPGSQTGQQGGPQGPIGPRQGGQG